MSNIKPRYNEIIFSEDQEKQIVKLYKNGMSTVKIGELFNTNHKKISKILDKNNISRTGNGRRKYFLNENYFDCIDTPNKAYILGFLYADGSNNPNKQTISMSLQEDDFETLESIRNEIGSQKPLEYIDYSNKHDFGYTYKNQYRLLMFSSKMCKSLIKHGMTPNKSLSLTFPEIDKELYSHFIRGYFDGDGCICRQIKSETNHAITVTITSTNDFCVKLQEICRDMIDTNAKIYDASCHNGITKVFTLSGRNISKTFLDWIYNDADLYLERKYQRYLEFYHIAA